MVRELITCLSWYFRRKLKCLCIYVYFIFVLDYHNEIVYYYQIYSGTLHIQKCLTILPERVAGFLRHLKIPATHADETLGRNSNKWDGEAPGNSFLTVFDNGSLCYIQRTFDSFKQTSIASFKYEKSEYQTAKFQ